jgi:hypothetical protein
MSNFELIDDYLTNRINEQDKKSFEQQMADDPSLKAEVQVQKEILEGLKSARVAELKAMLNKVPVATPTFYFSPLRIAAGLVGTAVLATGLYFYYDKNGNFNTNQISSSLVDSIRQTEKITSDIEGDSALEELKNPTPIGKKIDNADIKSDEQPANSKEIKPSIDLLDPSQDLTENNPEIGPSKTNVNSPAISIAKIEVTVNSSQRKFKSHYQFASGKLVLYGNFDDGLYEIIEVNAQHSRSLFLYYKTSYYLIDETRKEVTLLKEISDPVLLEKLKAFRAN